MKTMSCRGWKKSWRISAAIATFWIAYDGKA